MNEWPEGEARSFLKAESMYIYIYISILRSPETVSDVRRWDVRQKPLNIKTQEKCFILSIPSFPSLSPLLSRSLDPLPPFFLLCFSLSPSFALPFLLPLLFPFSLLCSLAPSLSPFRYLPCLAHVNTSPPSVMLPQTLVSLINNIFLPCFD